jgi:hypothetical protein
MSTSAKRVLTAGIAVITAVAIAATPSVKPPDPPAPAVQLTAAVDPLAQPLDPFTYVLDLAERVVIPPSASQPFPTPQFLPIVSPTSIGSTIKDVYNAIEPWVRYGFDLAAYAVGWIPLVGWLAPQITIFYNFGERIARSITYNIADWLDGQITFGQGLINVGVDTFNSFVQLGIDQLNFWLPSLPPLPPFPLAATPQEPSPAPRSPANPIPNITSPSLMSPKITAATVAPFAANKSTSTAGSPKQLGAITTPHSNAAISTGFFDTGKHDKDAVPKPHVRSAK